MKKLIIFDLDGTYRVPHPRFWLISYKVCLKYCPIPSFRIKFYGEQA